MSNWQQQNSNNNGENKSRYTPWLNCRSVGHYFYKGDKDDELSMVCQHCNKSARQLLDAIPCVNAEAAAAKARVTELERQLARLTAAAAASPKPTAGRVRERSQSPTAKN